ncbi:MAG: hypothetical protein AAFN51_02040 [Pseudomonadota bacterium]
MQRRAFLASTLALGGCGALPRLPGFEDLSRYSSDIDPATHRPIITIPGTLGSRLRVGKDGPFIWGGPNQLSIDPEEAESARMLALPFGDGTQPFRTLSDGIGTDGVLRRANARILGATVEETIYDGLITSLNAGGYEFSTSVEEERARSGNNPGSLEFPYDWRRDIVEAARDLDRFVERKAKQVERVRKERYGSATPAKRIRFDFVAHSMGCLVLRYWLMYGAQDLPVDGSLPKLNYHGSRRAACAIFVAPPNLGSIGAVTSLTQGRQLGPLQPEYPPALLGTHVSTYQLMPRDRHGRVRLGTVDGEKLTSLFDAETWASRRWGLMDPLQEPMLTQLMPEVQNPGQRKDIAFAYLDQALRRAKHFHRAMDRPVRAPATDMFLVVGTGLDTPAGVVIDAEDGSLDPLIQEEGDSVVLRASALSDERQGGNDAKGLVRPIKYRTVLLLPGEHVEITQNSVFADNLLYWLNDQPRQRVEAPVTPIIPGALNQIAEELVPGS